MVNYNLDDIIQTRYDEYDDEVYTDEDYLKIFSDIIDFIQN